MRRHLDLEKVEFAGFPQRIAARLIDIVLVSLLFYLFLSLAGEKLVVDPEKIDPNFGIGNLIWFLPVIYIAYEIPTLATSGLTIGKRIMGICVVRTDGLIGIGLDRALLRFLSPQIFILIPLVGSFFVLGSQLWFFFDDKRQNFPDKMARTFVIRIPKTEQDQQAFPSNEM